jgi:hypothetical protein
MAIITNHGEQRVKDRVGVSKKLAEKMADKALEFGIKHDEVAGELKKYLDRIYLSHKVSNNTRIYNQKVYLFNGKKLISVLDLPSKFHKTVDKIKKHKETN